MKLINHLTLRISIVFTVVMLFWSAIFFFLQMKEIHDGNDEGLTNLKQEFVAQANHEPGFVEALEQHTPLNIIIEEITYEEALGIMESFATTKIYFATEMEQEEVRLLTSAFRCEQNGKYYRLQFFTSTVESNDLIENILFLLLGLWLILSITLFTTGKVIIAKANQPFRKLLNELKKFRLDHSRMIHFTKTDIKEYRQLNESVREVLDKVIHTFDEQKVFIENVSHELQTPLAVVIAKLEMLIEKYPDNEAYVRETAGALQVLNRMKRLNASLLLLSKIKNRQFPETSLVNLRQVLETSLEEFSELIGYKALSVETTGTAAPAIRMNEDLAHIMLTNLLKNAIVHNHNGGKILICYQADSLSIANSGKAAATGVFDRYRTVSANESSSGLGLSIVKSVAELYNIDLSYRYDGLHVFSLRLTAKGKGE
jgi:signal transduction histidine kinase